MKHMKHSLGPNDPQESLENTINTTGTLLGVLPIVPWVFGSKKTNLQTLPDPRDTPRQNERLRCQHLLATPNTHDTLHLLGAIDVIEDIGWGVFRWPRFFPGEKEAPDVIDLQKSWQMLAKLFVVRIGVGHQKRLHNQAHRAVPRGIITGVYIFPL